MRKRERECERERATQREWYEVPPSKVNIVKGGERKREGGQRILNLGKDGSHPTQINFRETVHIQCLYSTK